MKKVSIFLVALFIGAVGLQAQQKRVVHVQGHPHELLTKKAAEGKTRTAVSAIAPDTTWINPDNIICWIDDPNLNPDGAIDSAVLMIKWTDGKALDSLFVWGYRWTPYATYGTDTTYTVHHGIDMLRTIANNDQRFTTMLQYSGVYGHSVGGIGMNWYNEGTSCSRVSLDFNIADAQKNVDFVYFGDTPNCAKGQVTVPYISPNARTGQAATESRYTGILVHPFGAEYGYPAYDFDYWYLTGYIQDSQHWQAGWVELGFWGYFRADNWRVPVPSTDFNNDPDAAQFGITYEPLQNRQVHGFVFEPNIGDYIYEVHYFNGKPIFEGCDCRACSTNKGGSKK
jgi:hypothetical protein